MKNSSEPFRNDPPSSRVWQHCVELLFGFRKLPLAERNLTSADLQAMQAVLSPDTLVHIYELANVLTPEERIGFVAFLEANLLPDELEVLIGEQKKISAARA